MISKVLFSACLSLTLAGSAGAQLVASIDAPVPAEASGTPNSAATVAAPQGALKPVAEWEPKFNRWVDLNEMDFSMRYRNVADSNGAHEFNQGQQRGIIDGKFKFDEQGKYGVVFHASTGRYFNWAYADFMGGGNKEAYVLEEAKMTPLQLEYIGLGTALQPDITAQSQLSGGWSFYVRRLYLDVEPVKGLEAQYGSLDINRGAGSEITTYDNDGYIDGERIKIKKPSLLYVDELSATWAYIGDLFTPNFFARGERLKQSNYHQFLMRKALWNKRVDASGDYTWQYGTQTIREAIATKVPEKARVADSVRFEAYQRINNNLFPNTTFFIGRANGYAFSFEKKFKKHGRVEYGYANIDPAYTVYTDDAVAALLGLTSNGDAYGIGKRFFARPTINVNSYLMLTGYYTHAFDTHPSPVAEFWNNQALNAGFVFDIKKLIMHGNDSAQ